MATFDELVDAFADAKADPAFWGEYESLLSIDKARSLLGYEPAHSWRDYVGP